ncbi:hypothetical protein NDU88_005283 [Pleurodeles waltl]|uniref:Uncharacterized protein n=1 Tax=Pleurodeles waltl TaxID=8319 RepID=A0AAV7QK95_PLEWA|nr:hypothetical protein NDU88_005283 [Pleurodeles waltl]
MRTLVQEIEKMETILRTLESERPTDPALVPQLLATKEEVAAAIEKLRCFDYKSYKTQAHAKTGKGGTLVAWLVNPTPLNSLIFELVATNGVQLYHQTGINDRFAEYYTALYARPRVNLPVAHLGLLNFGGLPSLQEEDVENLGELITITELSTAIKAMIDLLSIILPYMHGRE